VGREKKSTFAEQLFAVQVYPVTFIPSLMAKSVNKPKKILLFILALGLCSGTTDLLAQQRTVDSRTTLQWAEAQANRIEGFLRNAMREVEAYDIVVRLTDAYQAFDAVAQADVFCATVRAAAEAGRKHSDVMNYRLGKDLNSTLQRAVDARQQALRMGQAARACQAENAAQDGTAVTFGPNDILRYDALLAELDLTDGLAVSDMNILSQKLTHAMRLLYDVEHLALSLTNCEVPLRLVESAIKHCEDARAATNVKEAQAAVLLALTDIRAIQELASCD